ncbi:SDR family NAD(P)-dependent oxidoreductase [Pseudomonas sp. P8_241]|uniref:SDR family NAD(P)-dependent oxidoreductase n=1 Tax=Pseudomonas sp. P8_241 TaxID=3043445 RepID=UPI002A368D90|nr:SDR family NAD(P)-dependent oxidoreductase [Pseudomonas sp. P8_241]WPN45149.1 SDR family NAD(P)-dependent oxidoreductase [Pseudomonas sp. P8_241]
MTDLAGRRAFVGGGANGIGASVVRRLVADGAQVFIADRDVLAAEALAQEVGASSACIDLSDYDQVKAFAGQPFDILVNCAGVDQHAFFTHTSVEEWNRLMAVNLYSVLNTTHLLLPAMQAGGHGRIVNIASEAGRMGSRGGAVYAASKGAVIAFTRSIARESARYGVTANVITPGPIDTPLLRQAVAEGGDRLLDAMCSSTLVGRLGTPDEVAAAVSFLVSREAAYITGEVLGVSGGMGCGQ